MKKMTKGELQVRSRELQAQMSELNDKVNNEKRNFTEEEQNKWDALIREKMLVDAEIRAQLNERELAKYDERKSKGEQFRELLRETRDGGKQREILLFPTDTNVNANVTASGAIELSIHEMIPTLHEGLGLPEQLKIVTDTRLWNLLLQGMKKSEKLTKVEAFNDLIERQRIALLTSDDEYMKGNVLEFSKAWGWDRETVNRFLERLQELDIVTISMAGNRKAIKLNYII